MIRERADVRIDGERCKGCGLCIANCPKDAIIRSGEFNGKGYEMVAVDQERCVGCGTCYLVCPDYVFEIL